MPRGIPRAPIIVAENCVDNCPGNGIPGECGAPEEWYAFCPRDESLIEDVDGPSIVLCPEGHQVEVY